ncbi:MAG: gephyrin-like molybdotransferase Glp [bacterium]
MTEFFRVVTPDEIFEQLASFRRVGTERVRLEDAGARVLASEVASGEDQPPWPRSTMDGYAVKAADTFGATDALPGLLSVSGRVEMGKMPGFEIRPGQAAGIPTGGFLPAGADAVVMIEYTNPAGDGSLEVTRPVTAGENVMGRGEDVARGEILLRPGRRVRPQDAGLMAALGMADVEVFRRPRVAICSTGNEIVPMTQVPAPGQIRDANSYSVGSLVKAAGGEPLRLGIVQDEAALLEEAIRRGTAEGDVMVLSGGSSVGERDLLVEVVGALPGARVLAHGVAISPGKPMLLADVAGKALIGLPGHPVSATVVAQVFLLPFLRYIGGEDLVAGLSGRKVKAVLATSVASVQGREEYVRVRLEVRDDVWYAHPVFGRSGMLSTLVRSDGLVRVPLHAEGVARGEEVEVTLF